MDKEELIAMGLTEEQASKVVKAHKKELDGNYVPKERFNDVNEKLKTANQTITDRDSQIENLKKFEGTNEELQQKITDLQSENQQKDQDYQKKLNELKTIQKVKDSISSQKKLPYSVDDVLGSLDMEKIQLQDDKLIGFNEQYEQLTKDKPHWFKPEQQEQQPNQLFGFNFQGNEPRDGDDSQGSNLNKQEMFGKALADMSNNTDTTQSAMDYFFGKN